MGEVRQGDGSCVLAVDLGTGGPKVALVDRSGVARAWAHRAVDTVHLPGGGAEQDPEQHWRAVVDAAREVLTSPAATGGRVVAVAVTSQYMSTVPVAADGTPVGPCILWMDTRGGPHNLALLDDTSVPRWLERHGLFPLPSGNDGIGHVQHLRAARPDVYAEAAAFVEPMDHLTARLTGRVTATQSTAFGLLTVDNRTWDVTQHDPELVAASGLDPAQLPPLVPMGSVVGGLQRRAADALGLPVDLPVLAGTIDSITSAVGTGALGPDAIGVVIGTTSVIASHVPRHHTDLEHGILAVPSPLPDRWFVMAENGVGGRAVEWFLSTIAYGRDGLDDRPAGVPPDAFARLESVAAAVPAGAGGVRFAPWLLGSIAPAPDDDVRAAFAGLGLDVGRAELARAVLEGVALNAAWLLPHVEAFTGHEVPFVRFGGGGAQSDLWAQILADALGRPVHQLADPRTTNARGAALLAFAQLGLLELDDIPERLHVRAVREPDPQAAEVLAGALEQLSALHAALPR